MAGGTGHDTGMTGRQRRATLPPGWCASHPADSVIEMLLSDVK